MDHEAVADVDPHVPGPGREDQVSRLEVRPGNRAALADEAVGRVGQADAELAVRGDDQSGAVVGVRSRGGVDVPFADLGLGERDDRAGAAGRLRNAGARRDVPAAAGGLRGRGSGERDAAEEQTCDGGGNGDDAANCRLGPDQDDSPDTLGAFRESWAERFPCEPFLIGSQGCDDQEPERA